ncbi:Diphthamide synthase, putative [Angomonas deanei]|uniref:Diphthine--ammonia ligase n=1 Tax=Angomonas deanei TaxID=59799 RepID=A0A7G2CBD9_9TRYP|nr:Diphthamide synthase, putative [Angomonas deanei]
MIVFHISTLPMRGRWLSMFVTNIRNVMLREPLSRSRANSFFGIFCPRSSDETKCVILSFSFSHSQECVKRRSNNERKRMKLISLVSGGKDSILSMLQAVRYGHEPVVIAHVRPDVEEDVNSFMFQTVGSSAVTQIAAACNLPLRIANVQSGQSVDLSLHYSESPDKADEVETLFHLLQDIKREFPEVQGVTSGAILSNYQRLRVEAICDRLGLVSVAYLWMRKPFEILDMVERLNVHAIILKTASLGLDPKKLIGRRLDEIRGVLEKTEELYGSHLAGEGGEYETTVLDCPLFVSERLQLTEMKVVIVDDNDYSPTGFGVLSTELAPKEEAEKEASSRVLAELKANQVSFLSDEMSHLFSFTESDTAVKEEENMFDGDPMALLSVPEAAPTFSTYENVFQLEGVTPDETFFTRVLKSVADEINVATAFYFVVAVPQESLLPVLRTAYEAVVPHIRPPMRLFFVPHDHSDKVMRVKVWCSAVKSDANVLHNQSLSCWAAGRLGAVAEGYMFRDVDGKTVVVAGGVLGLDPTTGDVPTPVCAGENSAFFTQFMYAFANALNYYSYFIQTSIPLKRLVCFVEERYASYASVAWRLCQAQNKANVEAEDVSVIPVCKLETEGCLVALHFEWSKVNDDE